MNSAELISFLLVLGVRKYGYRELYAGICLRGAVLATAFTRTVRLVAWIQRVYNRIGERIGGTILLGATTGCNGADLLYAGHNSVLHALLEGVDCLRFFPPVCR